MIAWPQQSICFYQVQSDSIVHVGHVLYQRAALPTYHYHTLHIALLYTYTHTWYYYHTLHMRTLLIIPSSHIARQLITRIQSWQIVSTKVHLLKYIFAHYHHNEMLPGLFSSILKGLYWQISKENKNKHFSPICRIGSNAASVGV